MVEQTYIPEMIWTRRELHRRPELGWREFRTTERIVKTVRSLGFDTVLGLKLFNTDYTFGREPEAIRNACNQALRDGMDAELLQEMQGYTGCMAVFDTGRPGPVTAFRFDIDCVAVEEEKTDNNEAWAQGFTSEVCGLMHACGHDGHTAVGLTLARWIHDHADSLCGRIKLIFQPAEEGTRGALPMSESGFLDDVNYMVGSHIGNACHLGEVGLCISGSMATTKIDVRFTGLSAHAGLAPEKGRSALFAACNAATTLAGIARTSQGETRVSVGKLIAGEGRNVVAAHALMQAEVRGSTEEANQFMTEEVLRITQGIGQTYNVACDCQIVGRATTLMSTPKAIALLDEVARGIGSVKTVKRFDNVGGSEDCTWLIRKVILQGGEAAMFIFGCNHHGHHRGDFCIQDTQSLPVGFEMFTGFLIKTNAC